MQMVASKSLYFQNEPGRWGGGGDRRYPCNLRYVHVLKSHHLWPCPLPQSQSPLFFQYSFSFVLIFFLHPLHVLLSAFLRNHASFINLDFIN